MTHPFNLPDPEGQAARDKAKPMAPRESERVMFRDGQVLDIAESQIMAYAATWGAFMPNGNWTSYDIIAAVDADDRVNRTAQGPVDAPPATSPGVTAGAVRALKWHKSIINSWNGDYHTVPTAYTVRCADENGWKWCSAGVVGYERSPEAAKAAAQADYETRILSALVPGARVVTAEQLREWALEWEKTAAITEKQYVMAADEKHIAAMRQIAEGK